MVVLLALVLCAQQPLPNAIPSSKTIQDSPSDADGDGLPDTLEQALLERFLPQFHVSGTDCDLMPSSFAPGESEPRVMARDGTIYGQASLSRTHPGVLRVELRYFHLWGKDCGRFSHALDVEQVAGLVEFVPHSDDASGQPVSVETVATQPVWRWKALYWFAAGHQGTVCDVSHAARADTLVAEFGGPDVWISTGKHASYLALERCRLGCGGDTCPDMRPLAVPRVLNLGEPGRPLHGATWIAAKEWPLASKMKPLFTPATVAQMESTAPGKIVAVNRALPPVRATILAGGETLDGVAIGGRHSGKALKTGKDATGTALGRAMRAVAKALGATPAEPPGPSPESAAPALEAPAPLGQGRP